MPRAYAEPSFPSTFDEIGAVRAQWAAENPIVIENRKPGTSAWRETNFGDDVEHQIKGFASATSVNSGEEISFHVSVTPAQDFTLAIYRLGWYGGHGGRLMHQSDTLVGVVQPEPIIDATTGLITAPWESSYSLEIPTDWTSGIYLGKLINAAGFENYMIFTVRDDAREADFLYQQPVTTYQAYNNYPDDDARGKSLYSFNSWGEPTVSGGRNAVEVSFDRPYRGPGFGRFFLWEVFLIRWMERSGYDVTYSTNIDTHRNGAKLLDYKAFLSIPHDEYWSREMVTAAKGARDAGVHLAFMGANSIYWQVRFEDSSAGAPNRTMVLYRQPELDPNPAAALKTTRWRDIGEPEQSLLGIQYVDFTPNDIDNTDLIVQNTDHWLYTGSGFADGDVVPGIVGYEVDQQFADVSLPENQRYALLSSSPFTGTQGLTTANSAIYQAESGAWVFSSGTLSWVWALDKAGFVDERMQKTTANLFDCFLHDWSKRDCFAVERTVGNRVFEDSLGQGWADSSWSSETAPTETTIVHSGTNSFRVDAEGWGALRLRSDDLIDTTAKAGFGFWIHGGTEGGQTIQVKVADGASTISSQWMTITPRANQWTYIVVPFTLYTDVEQVRALLWQNGSPDATPTFYVDDVVLLDEVVEMGNKVYMPLVEKS